jgi:hypothetical protein
MPTTLTGLLLFVVLLLPGFAYLVGKERHGTERRLSPFRETVAIVSASVTSELVVIGIFAAVRALWPSITPDVGALLRQGALYLHGSQSRRGHYQLFALWGVGLLALAMAIAYAATIPRVRRVGERLTGPYPHESTVSAWWMLFERWRKARNTEVTCILDDGSSVRGQFGSFNIAADDSPDRDLILTKPIYYSPSGEEDEVPYPVWAVCIAARRIVTMFVTYTDPVSVSPSSSGVEAAPEKALSAAQQVQPSNRQLASAPWSSQALRPSALFRHLRQGARSARFAVLHGRAKPQARSPRARRP